MRRERPRLDLMIGSSLPLNVELETGRLLNHRAVNARWLTALVLLAGAAATLMLGAIHITVATRARLPIAPAAPRRVVMGGARRADRLTSGGYQNKTGIIRTSIEQIDDRGHAEAFVHIIARLAKLHDASIARDQQATDSRFAGFQSMLPKRSLPREVLFGSSGNEASPANTSSYAAPDDEQRITTTSPLGDPINVTVMPKAPSDDSSSQRIIVAKAGETLAQILIAIGTTVQDALAIAAALASPTSAGLEKFAGGERIVILMSSAPANPPILKISIERPGMPELAAALSDDGRYVRILDMAAAKENHTETVLDSVDLHPSFSETLVESLRAVAEESSVESSLIDEVMRLCAHDIDLGTQVSSSDTAELFFNSNNFGQPRLAFAALTINGQTDSYYQFTAPDDDSTDYYNADGRSVTESLLRKPVAAGRLGDGFGWRIHPVLRDRRFHKGVDYAAPYGSPVVAAVAGVIENIDQQWGYGKYIRIRHDLGYETTYAHLSGIARDLHVGDRVRQGQTIAYVGSTGLSTGPHLYYEIRINGREVDPLRIRLRSGRVLEGPTLAAFQKVRDRIDLLLRESTQ